LTRPKSLWIRDYSFERFGEVSGSGKGSLNMNTIEAIEARRSIRRFRDEPIPDEILNSVVRAATLAPSAKNRQPWRFVVVREDRRAEMVRVMLEGIERWKTDGGDIGSSEATASIMAQASVTVFVFNPDGMNPWLTHSSEQIIRNVLDTQSIGAAIQNMLLAALHLGLGSLWICDVFYAYEELRNWLGEDGQMIAAISLGYPDETPSARPRKPLSEVIRSV
jgi:F420 biosynthesis protein FbiB-like protein